MASPPFLRGLSSKTPKIEPFLWGEVLPLDLLKGAQQEVATCSPILILLYFSTFSDFIYI
jgi:hypothetical protein